MAPDKSRVQADADLADLLFAFMNRVLDHVNVRLGQLELNNKDYWALHSLDQPMRMNELATHMGLERSYLTVIADRLEERGLVERQPDPTDRRVKNLALTPKGRKIKATIQTTLWQDTNTFSAFTPSEHAKLAALFAKGIEGEAK